MERINQSTNQPTNQPKPPLFSCSILSHSAITWGAPCQQRTLLVTLTSAKSGTFLKQCVVSSSYVL